MGYDELNPDYLPPKREPEKKGHGCFFYGCLFAIIAMVLGLIIVGAGGYWVYRYAINTAIEYTDTQPTPMPPVTMPVAERKALHERVDSFQKGLNERTAAEPLVLNAEEINALIDDNPDFKGKAHVEIKDDEIQAKISIPLTGLPFDELKNRFFNGSAKLRVTIEDSEGKVRMEEIEARGKPVPEGVAKLLADIDIGKSPSGQNKIDRDLRNVESIVVKNGTVIITPKPPRAETETQVPKTDGSPIEEPKAEEPKPSDPQTDEPKVEEPPATGLPEPSPNKTDDPGTPAPEDMPKAA